MSLANGRPLIAQPGPSVMPDAVLQAMHRAAPNIYTGALHDLTHGLIPDLKRVARTEQNVAIYICNGHGTWEAALSNILAPGEACLGLAVGRFGNGWVEMAEGLGAEVRLLDYGKSAPIDMAEVEEVLRADRDHRLKAVLMTHVDTSTSRKSDVAGMRALLDRLNHPALLCVDCIASLGCDRFEMDDWGVDVMVAASQKGLMTPPGLGFVWFSDRAARVREGMARVSRYWDWVPRANPQIYYQYFGGTAPTHHLFGLRVALDMLMAEGMEAVWHRHEVLARAIWAACETWGAVEGGVILNVPDPEARSHAVTAARIENGGAGRLRDWLEGQAGVTLGIGLGMTEPGDPRSADYFRFGHMGHLNAHMVLGMLAACDAGMKALDLPHGAGALEAAARVVAEA